MNKCVKITFQPIIWRDENLNNASAGIGSTICHVFGETKEQVIREHQAKDMGDVLRGPHPRRGGGSRV